VLHRYGFEIKDIKINILDTPGHQDFAEIPTAHSQHRQRYHCYRQRQRVEAQTRNSGGCRMRNTPVMVFINKLDRIGHDPFDLPMKLKKN
jgi:peptide chain release factor 3